MSEMLINGEWFPTKKSLEVKVRALVSRYGDDEPLAPEDFTFMVGLFRHHEHAATKFGDGIASICVHQIPPYSSRGFYITRVDGTGTDISWRKCLTPQPHSAQVLQALRVLVEPSTMGFKQQFFDERGGCAACPVTGELITFIGSHVHHNGIPFKQLAMGFLSENGLTPNEVELKEELADNKYQPELSDAALAARWVIYHDQHATLIVVSKQANLSELRKEKQNDLARARWIARR